MDKIVQIGSIANGPWDNPSVGRVYDQNGLAPTLNSGGVAKGNHTSSRRLKHMDQIVVAMRGRDKGGGVHQTLEPQLSGCTNTLTSVQKDNLILEVEDDQECND